ncbi:MAG: DNA polymerase [Candidatus Methanomethylicaceae archaeon]
MKATSTRSSHCNDRKIGPIPKITSRTIPARLVVFDTEAKRTQLDGEEHQTFALGVARFIQLDDELRVIREEECVFEDVDVFLGFIERHARKNRTLYVFAHNIAYDLELIGLLPKLHERGFSIVDLVMNDPPNYIKAARKDTRIVFVDTFNYWQVSVEAMGKAIGREKGKYEQVEGDREALVEYCRTDVLILAEYLLEYVRFIRKNELGAFKLTLASQAFSAYRAKFMHEEIIVHNDQRALKLERDAYYGGRVECFRIGYFQGQLFYKLDVNSMYPFVMKAFEYPKKLVAYSENVPLSVLEKCLKTHYVIADVEITTQTPAYPCRVKDRLCFPVGRFRTVLHQSELLIALKENAIKHVFRLAIYEKGLLFGEYVDYFYKIKEEAEQAKNEVQRGFAKILLNSLYGKFGQSGHHTVWMENPGNQRFGRLVGYSERLGRRVETVYLGNKIRVSWNEGESYYSCPSIAGAVTAYARSVLWNYIETANRENVYYCDTDSLIVNNDGFARLVDFIDKTKIGFLKVEAISDRLTIYGLKDYVFGEQIKHKGIPKTAQKVDEGVWVYPAFERFKTWANRGMIPGVIVTRKTRRRLGNYTKGVIVEDRVIPITLRS